MTDALEGYTLPATPGEIGTAIKWDVGAAEEFAFQLLEDVNHHKLAKLLLIGMNFSDEELALVLRYLDKPAKPVTSAFTCADAHPDTPPCEPHD